MQQSADQPLPSRAGTASWARPDLERAERTGDPEVVFGESKTPEQVVALLRQLAAKHPERAVLATRLSEEALQCIAAELSAEDRDPILNVDEVARTATLGPLPEPAGRVAVICAGTTDLPIAHEAIRTVEVFGAKPRLIADVGVAGLHRILQAQPEFADADAIVVIAGMEGALPSVVGGLTGIPLVAVPTSIGYGASFGGLAALLGMLNSCAPGVVVTNIDNGFGAGVHAARIARAVGLERSRR